jgi:hypothetical protein
MRMTLVVVAILLTLLFGVFVWPTPYTYIVLAPVPPNSGDRYDTGTEPVVYRVNRLTGRVWILSSDLRWFSPVERAEIARTNAEEVKRRCKKAEESGAFSDPKNQRVIKLKGYTFSCP